MGSYFIQSVLHFQNAMAEMIAKAKKNVDVIH